MDRVGHPSSSDMTGWMGDAVEGMELAMLRPSTVPFFSSSPASEIRVFDINFRVREAFGDFCEHTRFVRSFDHEHFGLQRENAGFA